MFPDGAEDSDIHHCPLSPVQHKALSSHTLVPIFKTW